VSYSNCGNCGRQLGDRGWYRRRVPRKGGKKLAVCGDCASSIDKQEPLVLDEASEKEDKSRRERLRKETGGARRDGRLACSDCSFTCRWPGELEHHRFVAHADVEAAGEEAA
jgi:hypothetical protein